MPGRDGTGPMGFGQMSGKGLGLCSGPNMTSRGSGFGRGFKTRYCRNFAFCTNADSEKEFLSLQKNLLESKIDYINQKLEQL